MNHLILDTNVLLGHIHKNDRLNPKCNKLMENSKKHKITIFERLHKDDFNSAIKNRVNENMTKLQSLGLWDMDESGYKINTIDDLRNHLKEKKLTESSRKWIETIIENINSIDELRNDYPTKTVLIIGDFGRKFNSFIAHLDGKNRLQIFRSNRSKNPEDKNKVLNKFDNEVTMKEDFFSKIDDVYNRKGKMGLIDRKLLVMSYWCAMEFYNNDYLFATDDSDMKPKTDEIERIFGRTVPIRTIDYCIRKTE